KILVALFFSSSLIFRSLCSRLRTGDLPGICLAAILFLLLPAITMAAPATIRTLPIAGAHCTGATPSLNFAVGSFPAPGADALPMAGLNRSDKVTVRPQSNNRTPTTFIPLLDLYAILTISYQNQNPS